MTSLDETSLFFLFIKGCICAKSWHAHANSNGVCVCALVYVLCKLLVHVLQLIAHSAATWTVQLRPNFSIQTQTDTVSLSFLCHTDTDFLTENTHLHGNTQKGCRWWLWMGISGGSLMPCPCSFLFVLPVNEMGAFPQTSSRLLASSFRFLLPSYSRRECWMLGRFEEMLSSFLCMYWPTVNVHCLVCVTHGAQHNTWNCVCVNVWVSEISWHLSRSSDMLLHI